MQTAALFDLDGVIVDTEGQYTEFWKGIGNQVFPNVPDFAFRIKGHTLTQILNAHYPDNEAAQKRVVEELNVFEQNMKFPYIAGAVDFVKALRQAGIPTAVVTSSNNAKMQCLYRCHPELPTLFDRVFTAENARRSKPAPDCYMDAAVALGCKPEACCVFEDSISGLQAGQGSGAAVVGLTTGNGADTIAPLCNCVINDFTEFTVEQMLHLISKK